MERHDIDRQCLKVVDEHDGQRKIRQQIERQVNGIDGVIELGQLLEG